MVLFCDASMVTMIQFLHHAARIYNPEEEPEFTYRRTQEEVVEKGQEFETDQKVVNGRTISFEDDDDDQVGFNQNPEEEDRGDVILF